MAGRARKRLRIGYRHNLEVLTFILKGSGVLDPYGIDPEILHVPDSELGQKQLLDGSIDLFLGNHISPMVDRVRTGANFVYLAQPSNIWPSKFIVKPWIKEPKDLTGQAIATKKGNSSHGYLANKHMLEKGGLDVGSGKIAEVTLSAEKLDQRGQYEAFLKRDEVAGILLHPPFDLLAQRDGLRVFDLPEYAQVHNVTINAMSDFLSREPELTLNFLRAYVQAIHFFKTHKEKTMELLWEALSSKLQFDEAAIEVLYEDVNGTMQKKPYPSIAAIENTYEVARREFPEVSGLNPFSMWNLHFLRRLDDEGFIDELYRE